ncbi:MAG: hypothetical protein Q9182_000604 [Xanthomendoza sp. 2 TL-2023]
MRPFTLLLAPLLAVTVVSAGYVRLWTHRLWAEMNDYPTYKDQPSWLDNHCFGPISGGPQIMSPIYHLEVHPWPEKTFWVASMSIFADHHCAYENLASCTNCQGIEYVSNQTERKVEAVYAIHHLSPIGGGHRNDGFQYVGNPDTCAQRDSNEGGKDSADCATMAGPPRPPPRKTHLPYDYMTSSKIPTEAYPTDVPH